MAIKKAILKKVKKSATESSAVTRIKAAAARAADPVAPLARVMGAGKVVESKAAARQDCGLTLAAAQRMHVETVQCLELLTAKLSPRPVASGDAALEGTVDSLRRLLSELLEERSEMLTRALVIARGNLARGAAKDALSGLDKVLEELGAMPFEAERLDYLDPSIHEVRAERHEAATPDGVIVDTLASGWRTARGVVAQRAAVAVNRRP
ncbi:MAG: hypothetical protein WCL16_03910 [bacterium]